MEAKYKVGDMVCFDLWENNTNETCFVGKIVVVDYGTFYSPDEISYDIQIPNGKWFKHIPQDFVKEIF